MAREIGGGDLGLGEELKAARKRRGLTQAAAAAEIGVSRKTVVRIESGYYVAHANTRAKVRRWMADDEQTAAAAAERAAAEQTPEVGPDEEWKRPSRRPIAVAAASMELRRTVRRKAELALRKAVAKKMAKKRRRSGTA